MSAKKVIAFLVVLLAAAAVFAKKQMDNLEVGGTVTLGVPVGSAFKGSLNDWASDTKAFGAFDIGLGAFAHVRLDEVVENLGVQAELHFYSNAITGKFPVDVAKTKEYTFKYKSFDIPVLATYEAQAGDITIRPEAGAYISIPVGKMKIPSAIAGDTSIDTAFVLGLLVGMNASYPAGPGSIVGDIRFITDLASIKVDSEKFMLRRGLLLSAGYKIPLDL